MLLSFAFSKNTPFLGYHIFFEATRSILTVARIPDIIEANETLIWNLFKGMKDLSGLPEQGWLMYY